MDFSLLSSIKPSPTTSRNSAQQIAKLGGDGVVLYYNPETGDWDGGSPQLGKPLVLVSNWVQDSKISDSGFSEAAADAIFASLVQLNEKENKKIFESPMHLIGFSRGTVVTSELSQRLGTYFPDISKLHVTTLDPHDMVQPGLDVPLGQLAGFVARGLGGPFARSLASAATRALDIGTIKYSDFGEPLIQAWANESFHDNYWQSVADPGTFNLGSTLRSFTPNGRSIPHVDLEVNLNDRPGFTEDDPILGYATAHQRVKWWYAGTVNLGLSSFPNPEDEYLFRRKEHRNLEPRFADNPLPWYTAHEKSASDTNPYANINSPWEGIGEGWFYSELGGGSRPPAAC